MICVGHLKRSHPAFKIFVGSQALVVMHYSGGRDRLMVSSRPPWATNQELHNQDPASKHQGLVRGIIQWQRARPGFHPGITKQ